jgi:hypothetical protein
MQMMRGFVAAALAGLVVLAAGCGGGGGSSSSSGDSLSTASLAPKDAGAWVSIDTDPDSAQWQSLDALLQKIPGAEQALADPSSSPFSGAALRTEVLPAVGPQLVLVVPAGNSNPIVLVKPSDTDKLDGLLAKTDEHEIKGNVDGWTAIAASQKELDAYQAALDEGTLADSETFNGAMEGLPEEALATGFVNGKGLASGLGDLGSLGSVAGLSSLPGLASGASEAGSVFRTTSSSSGSSPSATCTITVNGRTQDCSSYSSSATTKVGTGGFQGVGVGSLPANAADLLRSAGFAVTVTDDTVHFEASLELPSGQVPEAYTPTLLDKVPSDALVAISFRGGASLSKQLGATAGAEQLKQLEQQLGVSFDDLAQALEGQGVLYVRPGAPIPEITLAVTSDDPAATKHVFDKVVAKLGGAGSQGLSIPGFELSTATAGDTVIVSTSKSAASSFGSGPSLTGTERFKTAAAAVELGDTTSGFLYVDVHGLAPLLQAALGAFGNMGGSSSSSGSDDVLKALASLDFLALNAVAEDEHVRVEGAVRTS